MSAWVKKRLAPLRPRTGLSPSQEQLRTQLKNVLIALESLVGELDAAAAAHASVAAGASRFARDFHALYPSDDAVRTLGGDTVVAVDGLLEACADAEAGRLRPAAQLERSVRGYIGEVKGLLSEAAKAGAGGAEAASLEARAARMGGARGDAMAQAAAARRRTHDAVMKALERRLRGTYEKHADMFRAVWTVYFLRTGHRTAQAAKFLAPQVEQAKRFERQAFRRPRRKSGEGRR